MSADDRRFPTSPLGGLDAGAAGRTEPCPKRTWCLLDLGHGGACVELIREKAAPADFGPKGKP